MKDGKIMIGIIILFAAYLFCRWMLKIMKLKPKEADRTIDEIDKMTGEEFELFTAAVLKGCGFIIEELTKTTGDYGADIIVSFAQIRIAVQCKRYSHPVGVKAVQEVISAMKHYDCEEAIVITNNYFTNEQYYQSVQWNRYLVRDPYFLMLAYHRYHEIRPTVIEDIIKDGGLLDEYYEKYGIRKYGFHGTSHQYVAQRLAEIENKNIEDLKIVTCHLGQGSSICAVEFGKSIDTSMGLTPLGGIPMVTRSGDMDPSVLTYIMKKDGISAQEMEDILNKKSGVSGISGLAPDFRVIESAANEGNERAQISMENFKY